MPLKVLLGHRLAKLISWAAIAGTVYAVQPYRPVVFMGHSMQPTYKNHELALATTDLSHLKRGDVVVIDTPDGALVKRIAYMPGDSVPRYYFAGEWLLKAGKSATGPRGHRLLRIAEATVPEGYVYLLGDNPFVSVDSRQLGALPISGIRCVLIKSRPAQTPTMADIDF